jgi:hypothetical protein
VLQAPPDAFRGRNFTWQRPPPDNTRLPKMCRELHLRTPRPVIHLRISPHTATT